MAGVVHVGTLRGARGSRAGVRHLHPAYGARAKLRSVGLNTVVGVPNYRGIGRFAPSEELRGLGPLRHGLRFRGSLLTLERSPTRS
jgi:hypothetical protein